MTLALDVFEKLLVRGDACFTFLGDLFSRSCFNSGMDAIDVTLELCPDCPPV